MLGEFAVKSPHSPLRSLATAGHGAAFAADDPRRCYFKPLKAAMKGTIEYTAQKTSAPSLIWHQKDAMH